MHKEKIMDMQLYISGSYLLKWKVRSNRLIWDGSYYEALLSEFGLYGQLLLKGIIAQFDFFLILE